MELQDVWKIYRMGEFDVPALAGVNLTIKTNEFVAITGPSGCGKSTMLNMIGCLDMPTRGKVLLEGKDISEFKSNDLARVRGKKIGFIFQTFNLYPTLTALENIQLPMRIHEIPEKEVEITSRKLLETVGLSEREAHFPHLSGGHGVARRRRVAGKRSGTGARHRAGRRAHLESRHPPRGPLAEVHRRFRKGGFDRRGVHLA